MHGLKNTPTPTRCLWGIPSSCSRYADQSALTCCFQGKIHLAHRLPVYVTACLVAGKAPVISPRERHADSAAAAGNGIRASCAAVLYGGHARQRTDWKQREGSRLVPHIQTHMAPFIPVKMWSGSRSVFCFVFWKSPIQSHFLRRRHQFFFLSFRRPETYEQTGVGSAPHVTSHLYSASGIAPVNHNAGWTSLEPRFCIIARDYMRCFTSDEQTNLHVCEPLVVSTSCDGKRRPGRTPAV